MDNSIANSKSNIHAHYDLSNELFQTFLDKDHMMYSCGLFDTKLHTKTGQMVKNGHLLNNGNNGGQNNNHIKNSTFYPTMKSSSLFQHNVTLELTGSLENAQTRKIQALLSRLEPLGPEHTLLDIGFGWGGICIYAAEKYQCKVTGITLSVEQKLLAEQKVKEKGLEHLITFELIDYREFSKKCKLKNRQFDRIVSCEMIEAVGHNHLNSFFDTVNTLLCNDGIFVMQAITMPDARYPVYVKSADFLNTIIFPGGCCPSLSALLQAMSQSSTLHLENLINLNLHYAETLKLWRHRFNRNLPTIISLGFDDCFIRLWNLYLCQCEAGFFAQCINLQILTFSRPGNPNMIEKRAREHLDHGMKLLQ